MFGYIRPAVPELRVHEYATYRAFYCGVCRGLGRQCGPFCRLFLQFDFTLLALALDLVAQDAARTGPGGCPVFPPRRLQLARGWAVDYAADAHGLLLLAKCMDDRADGGAMRALIPFFRAATREAARRRPELGRAAERLLLDQRDAEGRGAGADEAAEPFALFCSAMFTPPEVLEEYRPALEWMGRNLGRWIYLADALDDLDEDAKKLRFNPLGKDRQAAAERVPPQMNLCAQQALSALDVLPQHRHAAIVRNILEAGLFDAAETTASGKGARRSAEPLKISRRTR